MSIDFFIRIFSMIIFSGVGFYFGFWFGQANDPQRFLTYTLSMGAVGALFGLIATPYFTTVPVRAMRRMLLRVSAERLLSGLSGLVFGLLIAALLTFPLSMLPDPLGNVFPFLAVLAFGYFGVALFTIRQTDIMAIIGAAGNRNGENVSSTNSHGPWAQNPRTILLDTSVIIDGRVADIAQTGFLPGAMLIPRFVLNELQYIADSSDSLRRQRGRRGMEVLAELQKVSAVTIRISDIDIEGVREVDDKLVILARQLKCPILTNDYNLNRVAELQGVTILNINELANAVKSVVLPGETLGIAIIQEGKEPTQGVGYMDDGTMVVVEGGNRFIGQTKAISVTKVLQTAAGRMIFGKPED